MGLFRSTEAAVTLVLGSSGRVPFAEGFENVPGEFSHSTYYRCHRKRQLGVVRCVPIFYVTVLSRGGQAQEPAGLRRRLGTNTRHAVGSALRTLEEGMRSSTGG
jgi:hypothetical protein